MGNTMNSDSLIEEYREDLSIILLSTHKLIDNGNWTDESIDKILSSIFNRLKEILKQVKTKNDIDHVHALWGYANMSIKLIKNLNSVRVKHEIKKSSPHGIQEVTLSTRVMTSDEEYNELMKDDELVQSQKGILDGDTNKL